MGPERGQRHSQASPGGPSGQPQTRWGWERGRPCRSACCGGGHSEMGLLIDLANASVGHCINGPVQLGDDLADSLGSARRGGDDVLAGATAVSPQLA